MNILILSGSRNREGQTARAIKALCKGIADGGASAETLFLTELTLERCRQCDADGWGLCRREGKCIVEDDFQLLVKKVEDADVVVIANPVYFGDQSESMRAFLDRYRRITHLAMITAGREPSSFPSAGGTPVIAICYAGGSGNGTISCCASLEKVLQTSGFDVVDMIPVRRQNLEAKLPIIEMTGRWLATRPTSGPPFVPPIYKKGE
ncbi:MAG TPA: flavodoxin family protein [Dehalococcoidia bacterium]|nr:flavodoxin family protein [Dehalococcoidia bacterium]